MDEPIKFNDLSNIRLVDFPILESSDSLRDSILSHKVDNEISTSGVRFGVAFQYSRTDIETISHSNILVAVPPTQARVVITGHRFSLYLSNMILLRLLGKLRIKYGTDLNQDWYIRCSNAFFDPLSKEFRIKLNDLMRETPKLQDFDWETFETESIAWLESSTLNLINSGKITAFGTTLINKPKQPEPEPLPTTWWNKLWNRSK